MSFLGTELGRQLFDELVESTTEHAIIALDSDHKVQFWNIGACTLFGYRTEEVLGQELDRIFTPEDRAAGMVQQEFAQAAAIGRCEDERWHVRRDGSRFWGLGVLTPLRSRDHVIIGYGKIVSDHTDSKQLVESLRKRADAMAASDDQKVVFLATLAHELRGSLAPLMLSAQLVRAMEPRNTRAQTAADVMDRQVRRMKRLVEDLLDVSRLNWNKLHLERQPVVLQDVVSNAVEAARPLVTAKRQDLAVVMEGPPILLLADPLRLEQVVLNLLTNASKFTPEQGALGITTSVEGDHAVMRVFDSGIGLSPAETETIFNLFTQVQTSERTNDPGLGIGLALVHQLVKLHGGEVGATSDGRGKGSVFIVRLPRLDGPKGQAVAAS